MAQVWSLTIRSRAKADLKKSRGIKDHLCVQKRLPGSLLAIEEAPFQVHRKDSSNVSCLLHKVTAVRLWREYLLVVGAVAGGQENKEQYKEDKTVTTQR